ncbi:uncharacterized protein LOC134762908 [Penaeus indicus]|uniref:uncharacterized protein LOC134762908 n=1 Tax=Penaeus indicus TaxID=29960 RepID=UPI00300D5FDE
MRFIYIHAIVILLLPMVIMAAVHRYPDRSTIRNQLLGNIPCDFYAAHCSTRRLCHTGQEHRLCKGCYIGSVYVDVHHFCNGKGTFYDPDFKECVSEEYALRTCAPASNPVRDPGQHRFIQCSDAVTRPKQDWILDLYCTEYYLCTAGNLFQTRKQLCTNYYQCWKGEDGSWYTQLRNCIDTDKMYNYETDRCEFKPRTGELCR